MIRYGALKNMWFSSGLQYIPEIRAHKTLQTPCGISLDTAREELIEYLVSHAKELPPLFVDSGAFSEMNGNPFTVSDWHNKFKVYERLVSAFGDRCVIVAPDRIGDQAHTMSLIRHFKNELLEFISKSNVIVPLQKPKEQFSLFDNTQEKGMTQIEMYEEVLQLLNDKVIAGIPFKKAATSYHDYCELLKSPPRRIHILGVTPFGEKWKNITSANKRLNAEKVTFDGCRIRSLIGKGRVFTEVYNRIKDTSSREEAIEQTIITLKDRFFHPSANQQVN